MKQQKQFLVLSFIVGFSVMVVELTAARIIAPIAGNSIYTWTSIIGIILLGTSAGNYLGGRMIDKNNKPDIIATFFLLASLFILYITLIAQSNTQITQQITTFWLALITIVSLLFLIPAFLLGGIYPMIVKQFVQNISNIGQSTGSISASWSIGSIVGTFLTGFIFIGYLGSAQTLLTISALLFFCSFWLYKKTKARMLCLVTYIIATLISFNYNYKTPGNPALIFSKESNYYDIKVADIQIPSVGKTRLLLLDGGSHSFESLSGIPIDSYTNSYPFFSIFNKNIKDVAVIGGGSLALSNNFRKYYPNANIETIEIDPAVTATAEAYFTTDSLVTNNTQSIDGRVFLMNSNKKYDIIFSDAYNSFISVPWHLATQEFFRLAKSRLSDDGAFAINIVSPQEGEDNVFFNSLLATFTTVFDNHYILTYGNNPLDTQNIVLIGLNSSDYLSDDNLVSKLSNIKKGDMVLPHLMSEKSIQKMGTTESTIFTDDFAPTDRLLLTVIEKYLPIYRKMFSITF